ncbi:MAG: TonB-dependent receptor, partial [Caulobacteraceae bacterium]|nr:TonB-dependent receptor [Caulobacteraceae bacterium]
MRMSRASRRAAGFRAALLLGAALPLLLPAVAAAQEASDQVSTIEVVAQTPLPGSGLAKDKIAGPVQSFSAKKIDDSNALDFSRFLERTANGVYVNDVQNNPLQADINYRGYTASPLLGTPQGISVYMDGVRLNQPFGDVVSWDLLPRMAINRATLIPGSNPLFGLNTLGGAISIQTKSGLNSPGTDFVVAGDNFDSRRAEIESGGSSGETDWYGNYNSFSTNGWRQTSDSRDQQGLGKLGWHNDVANVALSVSGANSELLGNGLQDPRLLDLDRTSVYTKPDITRNKSLLVNLTGSYNLSDAVTLTGNVYDRSIRTRTFNGDLNDDALGENLYQAACTTAAPASSACQARQRVIAAGYGIPLFAPAETITSTPFPVISCLANSLLPVPVTPGAAGHGEPYEKCDGLINQSHDKQKDRGVSGQFNFKGDFAGRTNLFIAGASYSENSADFRQTTQFGYLMPDRSVQPAVGPLAFADGSLENDDGELVDNRVDMRGETRAASLYATD